jgi:hypothetical protein
VKNDYSIYTIFSGISIEKCHYFAAFRRESAAGEIGFYAGIGAGLPINPMESRRHPARRNVCRAEWRLYNRLRGVFCHVGLR